MEEVRERGLEREMAQKLTAFAILTEDWGLSLRVHMAAHTTRSSSFRGPDILFWPPRALHIGGVLSCRQNT